MKNIFAIILLSFCTLNIQTQWLQDVRLTNDPEISSTTGRVSCIASNGSVVHVIWWDGRDGNPEIYYKRSADGGVSWAADMRLTNNSASSTGPTLTISGQIVHVVWDERRDGNSEIYYKRSTNGGISWGADIRLTNNSASSIISTISVSGQVVHVIWVDERDGNPEIYYKHSTDEGISWGTDTRLTNNTATSDKPSVSVSGSAVHVVWQDLRDPGGYEIYYKRSSDGGVNWSSDTRLTNDSAGSGFSSVSVSGSVVHVIWADTRDGNFEIYYKTSANAGISWGSDTRLTNYAFASEFPSLSVSGEVVHVVWYDSRDDNEEIYYKSSTDAGTSWSADVRLTNNPGASIFPSVSASGSAAHVVWLDNRDGNPEIYYKRNPTGNQIGIENISTDIPKTFSLYQNYPNPFNPVTKIRFDIPKSDFISLKIFDVLGREVWQLVNEQLEPGTYEVDWNAENYPSGIYYYIIKTTAFSQTKKMVLIK